MPQLKTPVGPNENAVGPADAPATLVEYGDFQCPDCGQAEPILQEVRRRMGERLRFVWREFPLTDIHEHALDAAVAAEFAGQRGWFWPMHDRLLASQTALSRADLEGYANDLGLDQTELGHAFGDLDLAHAVQSSVEDGEASGVQGTPTLFLNGERYDGEFSADAIVAAGGG